MTSISQKWRLEKTILGQNLDEFCSSWEIRVGQFNEQVAKADDLLDCILQWQRLSQEVRHFSSLACCLFAEDVASGEAKRLSAKAKELEAMFEKATTRLEHKLLHLPTLEILLNEPKLQDIRFALSQRIESLRQKMDVEKEALVTDLAINGYHGWYELYKQSIGQMRIDIIEGAVQGSFSYSQVENFIAHPSREVRKAAFQALETACKKDEALFSQAIRAVFGFRQQLYSHRGWNNYLHEALWINALQESSLNAMWEAVDAAAPIFHQFLQEMAKTLQVEKLSWYDLEAPFPGKSDEISYEESAKLIIEQFSKVSQEMGDFAKLAFSQGWIESENRPGKAPGGFCTSLPLINESRVYLNYSNNTKTLLTLAHELGHAYHSHVCFELDEMAQKYPMTLAETASTTAELLVFDKLLTQGSSREERKKILYEKVQRHSIFFLNIRARFLFEKELVKQLQNGYVSADVLCQSMQQVQKHTYGNMLETHHPYFWISKMHFYFTDIPSYNFPYSFGYILSLAINSKAKDNPKWFGEWYRHFLQDTGRMTCENLIKKHFDLELSSPLFWQQAIQGALSDVQEFLEL